MLSIVLSTIAFFVSSYYISRYLDNMGLPKGMTRGVLVFSIALLISYVVALAADYLPQ
jgi:VIT1/CCC1 family predicted Fe2+/Mn2+ transporter